jgi:hypothetical protein
LDQINHFVMAEGLTKVAKRNVAVSVGRRGETGIGNVEDAGGEVVAAAGGSGAGEEGYSAINGR